MPLKLKFHNPKRDIVPKDQITPINTTNIDIKVALIERKNIE